MTQSRRREGGFTMIEVMIAVLLTVIAVIGIIALFMTETRASSYSRRATEATSLATDKLEKLRTMGAITAGDAGFETSVDAQGNAGMFDRKWSITVGTNYTDITVQVGWDDDIKEATSCTAANESTVCTSKFCRPASNKCATRAVVVRARKNN